MGDGVGRRGGRAGAVTQEDKDEAVDDDGAEHGEEDPEIVEPETLVLVIGIDPALF